jgi:hypothetical protein
MAYRVKNIALRQYSEDVALRVNNDRRANLPRRQKRGGFGQCPSRLNGDDVPSLCREYACDNHLGNPFMFLSSCAGPPVVTLECTRLNYPARRVCSITRSTVLRCSANIGELQEGKELNFPGFFRGRLKPRRLERFDTDAHDSEIMAQRNAGGGNIP